MNGMWAKRFYGWAAAAMLMMGACGGLNAADAGDGGEAFEAGTVTKWTEAGDRKSDSPGTSLNVQPQIGLSVRDGQRVNGVVDLTAIVTLPAGWVILSIDDIPVPSRSESREQDFLTEQSQSAEALVHSYRWDTTSVANGLHLIGMDVSGPAGHLYMAVEVIVDNGTRTLH